MSDRPVREQLVPWCASANRRSSNEEPHVWLHDLTIGVPDHVDGILRSLDAARATPVDGETLRAAINKACSLTNPRLSEVDWDDVAAALPRGVVSQPELDVAALAAVLESVSLLQEGTKRQRTNLEWAEAIAIHYTALRAST